MFDPTQKTLLADKGEIRVGSRYQTEVQALLRDPESDTRKLEELESLVWTPTHLLSDRKIDQFLVVSRSVGTFARALDCSSSVKQPSLHMSAAAASRDITLVRPSHDVTVADLLIENVSIWLPTVSCYGHVAQAQLLDRSGNVFARPVDRPGPVPRRDGGMECG